MDAAALAWSESTARDLFKDAFEGADRAAMACMYSSARTDVGRGVALCDEAGLSGGSARRSIADMGRTGGRDPDLVRGALSVAAAGDEGVGAEARARLSEVLLTNDCALVGVDASACAWRVRCDVGVPGMRVDGVCLRARSSTEDRQTDISSHELFRRRIVTAAFIGCARLCLCHS